MARKASIILAPPIQDLGQVQLFSTEFYDLPYGFGNRNSAAHRDSPNRASLSKDAKIIAESFPCVRNRAEKKSTEIEITKAAFDEIETEKTGEMQNSFYLLDLNLREIFVVRYSTS